MQFGQAVNQAARQQGAGAREAEAALRRQEKALVDSLNKVMKLNDEIRKSGANPAHFNATTQQINRLVRELANGRVSALQFQRSMEDISTSMGRTKRAIDLHVLTEKRAAEAARVAAQAARTQEQETMRLERTLHTATLQVERYNAAVARAKGGAAMAGAGNSALAGLSGALRPGASQLDIQRASQAFQSAMTRNVESLRKFRKEGMQGATPLTESLRRLADVSILLNGPLGGIAARMSLLSTVASKTTFAIAALVAGTATAIYTFIKLGRSAIDASKTFERVTQALSSVNEMAITTQTQLKYLMRESDQTGTQFAANAQAFSRLSAAAAGTNLEGDRTREIFESVTAAGAKLNLTQDDVTGTLRAIEQIMSKGTVQAEELRGQLGDRLPGAFNIMARALGVTTAELGKMMKQGEITSDALIPFVRELVKTYKVDLNAAITTATASEGRLVNAFLRAAKATDDAVGFSAAYKAALGALTNVIDQVTANIVPLVGWFKTAAITIAFMFAPTIISGFVSLIGLVKNLTLAMIGLNAASMRNPFVALASVAGRLVLAFAGLTLGMNLFNDELRAGSEAGDFDPITQSLDQLKSKMEEATTASAAFRAELQATIEMQRAMAQSDFDRGISQLQDMQTSLAELDKRAGMGLKGIFGEDFSAASAEAANKLAEDIEAFKKSLDPLDKSITEYDVLLGKLHEIQTAKGDPLNPLDPGGGGGGTDSEKAARAKAMREAAQGIAELNAAYAIATSAPAQRDYMQMQLETAKGVQDFKDKLVDAKVPMETVTMLTDKYAAALARVNKQEYDAANHPNIFGELADVLGDGMDEAFLKFLDNIAAGKDAMTDLKNIAKSTALELLKTFAQLAVLNPLKNALFGGNYSSGNAYPTMGGGAGGIGGLLGSLLSNIIGGTTKTGSAFTGGWGSQGLHAAGGADFTIPSRGRRARPGMDSQLVSFFGAPGEEVSIGKRGWGAGRSGSGGTTVLYNQNLYGLTGNEEVVALTRDAAHSVVSSYDKGSVRRTGVSMLKGRTHRVPGTRGAR